MTKLKKFTSAKSIPLLFIGAMLGFSVSLLLDKWREQESAKFVTDTLSLYQQTAFHDFSDRFHNHTPQHKETRNVLMQELQPLGKLNNYHITYNDVSLKYMKEQGFLRFATVNVQTQFEKGPAEIQLFLMHANKQWWIERMIITSNILTNESIILR